MALTDDEKKAVLACKYFGDYWGEKPEDGLCPAGIVAQMRGINFDHDEETGHYRVRVGDNYFAAQDAAQDIAHWLNIDGTLSFYDVLSKEREKILERAPKE